MQLKSLLFLCTVAFLIWSCGNGENTGDEKKDKIAALIDATETMRSGTSISDTALAALAAGKKNDREDLKMILPDSVFKQLAVAKEAPLHILGYLRNKESEEIYFIILSASKKKQLLSAVVFDEGGHYLNFLTLMASPTTDGYQKAVTISSEPTFSIYKQKKSGNNLLYTRNAYAYNHDASVFMVVVHDSNEDKPSPANPTFVNPIDTLPRKNMFSGDYKKNDSNILTLRDGKDENHYMFFIFFTKKDCKGELKGSIEIKDKKAVYSKNGDPCVMDFTFQPKLVKIKERGSCGNHRGITCFFDDEYRKTELKKK